MKKEIFMYGLRFDILRIQKIKSKEGIKIKLRTQITRIMQIIHFFILLIIKAYLICYLRNS